MDHEEKLNELVKQGDKEALAEFADLKKPQLLGFIGKNISDALKKKIEPEDILQEVIISAMGSFSKFDLGDREPFSWLCHLAERRIIDSHRKYITAEKRSAKKEVGMNSSPGDDQKGLIDILAASITSPSKAFSRDQKEFHMIQALESLPADARTALTMRYINSSSSKEIAAELGKSEGAVRVLLTRSLSKLNGILSQNSLYQSLLAPPPE